MPALYHDGIWSTGYWPIIKYLTSNFLCTDLDEDLTPGQQADRTAYGAYLAARAAPLLDLSLYVSAANWAATTRPAYSKLLPFPLTWTVPPLIRAEAVKRVAHLGFADMDSDFDPNGGLHLSTGRDALPETFRRHLPAPKKTVHEEMTPEQAVAIRLYGLTEDCLSVLDDLLKGEVEDEAPLRFFDQSSLSSLDCLAYGYLALMREAPVPRSFLKDWMEKKALRLSKFVGELKDLEDQECDTLPWTEPATTALGVTSRTFDSIVRNVPSLGEEYTNEVRQRTEKGIKGVDRRMLILGLGVMVTGVAVGYGLQTYRAMQPFGARTQKWYAQRDGSRLSDFGELGSMLGSVMGGYPPAPSTAYRNQASTEPRIVETDTEVD